MKSTFSSLPGLRSRSCARLFALLTLSILSWYVPGAWAAPSGENAQPHVAGGDVVARGRYLVVIGGCNDCHTQDYLMTDGNVAEENWLAGNIVGWRGPWGTTYPPNLRLRAQEMTEAVWVEQMKTRKALPPMPWVNVNQMDARDSAAIYQYIRSLGPLGQHMPAPLPPDQEPVTPYLSLFPQNLPPMN